MAKWPYSTQRWQKLRRVKLSEDPLCRACLERGITKPADQVDHKLAIEQGGDPWDWDNLQSLCGSCHSEKTAHVDRQGKPSVPIKGCDVHGMPLDPNHPWNQEQK